MWLRLSSLGRGTRVTELEAAPILSLEDLQNPHPNAVVMILTDERGERILVNQEYRMAMARWIYNFPAGLIDPGETPEESAKRELWEETGLTLVRIDDNRVSLLAQD